MFSRIFLPRGCAVGDAFGDLYANAWPNDAMTAASVGLSKVEHIYTCKYNIVYKALCNLLGVDVYAPVHP